MSRVRQLSPFVARTLSTVLAIGTTNEFGLVFPDEVRKNMDAWNWGPSHQNAWGAAYRSLESHGLIEKAQVGAWADPATVNSSTRSRKGGRVCVYRLTPAAYDLIEGVLSV